LKTFRPLDGKPLTIETSGRAIHRRLALAVWAAFAAAILAAGVITFRSHQHKIHSEKNTEQSAGQQYVANLLPQTLGGANFWLAHAPPFKTALDQLPFHSQSIAVPEDKKSAISVLSKDTDLLRKLTV
jgi:hypothetical protein